MSNPHSYLGTRLMPVAAVLLLCVAAGCGDILKQPYPAKEYFGIDPGVPESPTTRPASENAAADGGASTRPTAADAVLVRSVRIIPPFDGSAFVYRDGANQYASDYYVNWIAAPASLMTGGLTEWLERAGVSVVTPGESARPPTTLDSEVTCLMIDRTEAKKPKAVLSIRFFLTRETDQGTRILIDRSFSATVAASTDAPGGYAAACGMAYRQILRDLSAALRDAPISK